MARFSQSLDVGSVLDREEKFEQAKAEAAKREEERRRQAEEERKRQEERKAAEVPPSSPGHHAPAPHAAAHHPTGKPPLWIVLGLLAIVLIAGFKVLTIPAKLSHIDELAEEKVEAHVLGQLTREVTAQYPEFPAARHAAMAQERLRVFKQDPGYGEFVRKAAEGRKALYRDAQGQTYLYSTDPYYYLRLAAQHEEATPGAIDELRNAPIGTDVPNKLFPALIVSFHNAWRALSLPVSLEKAAFYLPVALGLLSLTLFFLLVLALAGPVPAFVASFVLAIHPRFFVGTHAGYTDTQALVIPLGITIVLLTALAARERLAAKWRVTAAIGAAGMLWVLRQAWTGWYEIAIVLAFWLVLWGGAALLKNRKTLGLAALAVGLGLALLLVNVFAPMMLSRLVERTEPDFFPAGYGIITELQGYTVREGIHAFGGLVLVMPVLAALAVLGWRGLRTAGRTELLAVAWLLATAAAGVLSRRFSTYAAPPFALVLGLGLALALPHLTALPRALGIAAKRPAALAAIAVLLPTVALAALSPQLARYDENLPLMNDALVEAGREMRRSSPEDAIVHTWWSHGYQVQYMARRATVFDGAIIGGPWLYWMARAFTTEDGRLAQGIFRMIDCDAIRDIIGTLGAGKAAIAASEQVITGKLHPGDAIDKENEYARTRVTIVEAKLNCAPPDGFVMMTESIRQRLSTIPNYARDWDFSLAELRMKTRDMPYADALALIGGTLNLTPEEAAFRYEELRGFEEVRNTYRVSDVDDCIAGGDLIGCANDFFINMTALDARKAGTHPERLVLVRNGTREERRYEDGKGGFAVVVFQDGSGSWESFLIDDWLADSMAVRWYTAERGDWYEPVFVADEPERVVVHRINWNTTNRNA